MAEISVLCTSFNYGCFLAEALDSILACDAPGFAYVLVVDDASTDNTPEVAARYGRVDYIRNDERLGIVMNLNRFLTTMPTEWVCLISADDWIEPRFVKAHSDLIDSEGNDPRLAMVYCGATYRVTHKPTERPGLDGFTIGMRDWDPVALQGGNYLTGSTVVRRDALIQVGGFEDVPLQEDWATWRKFAAHGFRGACVKEALINYRLHNLGSRDTGTDSRRAVPGWRAPEAAA